MKIIRIFCLLSLTIMLVNVSPISAGANSDSKPYPETNGKAVILMDAHSGRVLYEHNSHEQLPPASLTKIMTGLLVVENGDLEQRVTASEHAVATPESTIYLEPGEILTRMELLYAAMLPSANDACTALAESVAGDEAGFVAQMNKRADELGLKNTHFANPHGLEAKGHYSSAYDLALLTRQALSYPVFAKVTATKKKVIPWTAKEEDRILLNHNRLLYNYDGAIGVKTGYTRQAGNCVVGAAQRGDMLLIAVTMNSPTVYKDLQQMLDYGFEQYKMVILGKASEVAGTVNVLQGAAAKVKATLPRNLTIAASDEEIPYLAYSFVLKPTATAPVEPGDILGICRLYLKGEQIGSINMVADERIDVKRSWMETSAFGKLASVVLAQWRLLLCGLILLAAYLYRKSLGEALKQVILFLLPAEVKERHRRN